MTRRLFLLPLLAAAWLLPWLSGCSWLSQELEKPDIRVVDVKRLSGGSLMDQRFALRLHLHNPNDQRFHIRELSFRFDVGDRELMHGSSREIPVIEPLGDVEFTVKASANVIDTVQLLDELSRHPGERVGYTLHTQVELAEGWPSRFHFADEGEVNLLEALTKKLERKSRKDGSSESEDKHR